MRLAPLLPSPESRYVMPALQREQTHVWTHPATTVHVEQGVLVELAPGVRILAQHDDEHPYRWLPDPPDWHARAVCRGMDQTIFYGTDAGACTLSSAELARARRVCAPCPVKRECLTWALEHGDDYGVHGGISGRGRKRLLAHQQATGISTEALVEEALR